MRTPDVYSIFVDREDFNFSAAQFLMTPEGLEPLSGHNYQLGVQLIGEVNQDGLMVDFRTLKSWMRRIISTLNHKTLIPKDNPKIGVRVHAQMVNIISGDDEFSIPISNCIILPIRNTSCEELSSYIAGIVEADVRKAEVRVSEIIVSLGESPGQGARITRHISM